MHVSIWRLTSVRKSLLEWVCRGGDVPPLRQMPLQTELSGLEDFGFRMDEPSVWHKPLWNGC